MFSLTYWLLKKEKLLAAGIISSLLLFKPQLVLGLGLLWLLEWRKGWKSLLGLILGGGILAGFCFWLLPDASRAYIDLARNFLPGMIYQEQFPLLHMHSLRGFWLLLFPGNRWLVEGLSIVLSILGVVVFYYYWRKNRGESDLLFAGAICLTIWITPHAMIYDWSILLIPAIILWRTLQPFKPLLKSMFTLVWIATFISGPLTLAQLKILPVAIQISIPVLFFVFFNLSNTSQRIHKMMIWTWLNPKRLRDYPRLVLITCSAVLLLNFLLRHGWIGGLTNYLLWGDFIIYYAAGQLYINDISHLYDYKTQETVQLSLIGSSKPIGLSFYSYPRTQRYYILPLRIYHYQWQ